MSRRTRRRLSWSLLVTALVVVAAAVAVVLVGPSPTSVRSAAARGLAPKATLVGRGSFGPAGTMAADPVGGSVAVYDQPGGSPRETLSQVPEGGPVVFLVKGQRTGWVQVQLPERPNGATGWVPFSQVKLRRVDTQIQVSLSGHSVTLLRSGKPVVTATAVVGAPATPTPTGNFYVTSRIPLENPNGPYGVGAMGLAAFSDVYTSFSGGPGQVAIHGTNEPELLGQSVSHGCVRISNANWQAIANQAPTGTPVVITP